MDNLIQIKRGSGTTPALVDGELGFNKDNKILSIGTDGGNVDVGRPILPMTQAEYNAATKDDDIIYIIESDDALVTQSALSGYVPTSRTINGKALSSNISLSASDVSAAASSHNHAASEITSGTLSVSRGGTGRSTLTSGSFLKGNGTSTVTLRTPAEVLSDIGAAPSGYGLGELTGATVEDLNAAVNNGFYKFYANAANAPTTTRGWLTVSSSSSGYTHQIVYTYDSYSIATRFCMGSTWQPWEWINPPMAAGVEYCTTERWQGKPVYRKLIQYTNTTAFSGIMTINIPHGISDLDMILTADCTTDSYLLPYATSNTMLSISAWSKNNLTAYCNSSWGAGRKWYIELRYTKTS